MSLGPLLSAVLYVLTTCGPEPAFIVETYEICIRFTERAIRGAKCEELEPEE